MRKKRKSPHASISPAEAERAIYVDFEGFMNKPPSLLGILIDGSLAQVVLDSQLTSAARAKGCETAALCDVAAELKRRCVEEQRRLVGYSQHELDVFLEYTGIDFGNDYGDARMVAKRWWNICRPGVPRPDNGLKAFLEAIGQPMPAHFGERKATSRLKAVIDMLSKRGSYNQLTPVVKAKWRKLLNYNAHDCHGMQALVAMASVQIMAARS